MTDPRLHIDKFDLDEELVNNPALVQEIHDEYAEAVAIRDTKKEALKTIEAQLDAEMRDILSKTAKVTEKVIESAVQMHPRRKQAFVEWNEASLNAAKAYSLVEAISARSADIKELCKLYIGGYYAIDSVKRSTATQEFQYSKLREQHAKERLQK